MKKIAVAFVWAFVLSQILGLCLAGLLFWAEWPFWYWPLLFGTYTVWFAWLDARQLLATRLGNRDRGLGIARQGRFIPINTMAGAVFEFALPAIRREKQKLIEVGSTFVLYSAKCEVSQPVASRFIRGAFTRQLRGKSPFSRQYWTSGRHARLSRDEYDCIVENLSDFGFIAGRRQGKSGELTTDCEKIITKLRHNLN